MNDLFERLTVAEYPGDEETEVGSLAEAIEYAKQHDEAAIYIYPRKFQNHTPGKMTVMPDYITVFAAQVYDKSPEEFEQIIRDTYDNKRRI